MEPDRCPAPNRTAPSETRRRSRAGPRIVSTSTTTWQPRSVPERATPPVKCRADEMPPRAHVYRAGARLVAWDGSMTCAFVPVVAGELVPGRSRADSDRTRCTPGSVAVGSTGRDRSRVGSGPSTSRRLRRLGTRRRVHVGALRCANRSLRHGLSRPCIDGSPRSLGVVAGRDGLDSSDPRSPGVISCPSRNITRSRTVI